MEITDARYLETVYFRTNTDDDTVFLSANRPINAWLKQQPGYKSRHLTKKDDGSWLDLVVWNSLEEAQSASARLMKEFADSDFMKMFDPDSVRMEHSAIVALD